MSKHRADRRRYALWQLKQAWHYYIANIRLAYIELKYEVKDILEQLRNK